MTAIASQQQSLFQSEASSSSLPSTQQEDDLKIQSVISNLPKINVKLRESTPEEILEWAIDNLPGLYQTTAFGITGCVTLDQVARISEERANKTGSPKRHLVPLIFLDTLYHFPQTVDLAHRASKHYSAPMYIYGPENLPTVSAFEAKYGGQLWEKDEDMYDYLVKVEPARRAYAELKVRAVFTGRRRSQGSDRASLEAVEVDETGLIKVNPFLNWSFAQVDEYVKKNAVPYNELLDMGYKSIGDWHSTSLPTAGGDGQDERSGRWKDKAGKTECGLHKDYFKFKKVMEKRTREAELAAKDNSKDAAEVAAMQQ